MVSDLLNKKQGNVGDMDNSELLPYFKYEKRSDGVYVSTIKDEEDEDTHVLEELQNNANEEASDDPDEEPSTNIPTAHVSTSSTWVTQERPVFREVSRLGGDHSSLSNNTTLNKPGRHKSVTERPQVGELEPIEISVNDGNPDSGQLRREELQNDLPLIKDNFKADDGVGYFGVAITEFRNAAKIEPMHIYNLFKADMSFADIDSVVGPFSCKQFYIEALNDYLQQRNESTFDDQVCIEPGILGFTSDDPTLVRMYEASLCSRKVVMPPIGIRDMRSGHLTGSVSDGNAEPIHTPGTADVVKRQGEVMRNIRALRNRQRPQNFEKQQSGIVMEMELPRFKPGTPDQFEYIYSLFKNGTDLEEINQIVKTYVENMEFPFDNSDQNKIRQWYAQLLRYKLGEKSTWYNKYAHLLPKGCKKVETEDVPPKPDDPLYKKHPSNADEIAIKRIYKAIRCTKTKSFLRYFNQREPTEQTKPPVENSYL
jgi:hypothetical protein